jgi:hypothetical protein
MWRALAVVLIVTSVNAGCRHRKTSTPPIDVARSEQARERLYFEDVPVTLVHHWYWCFAAKVGPDLCGATKELCEQSMASLGIGTGCVPAPRGVCLHVSRNGGKPVFGSCFRTAADCKRMTGAWIVDKTGEPIVIGCTIFLSLNPPAG